MIRECPIRCCSNDSPQLSIHDGAFSRKFVNYFREKAPSQILDCVLNTPQNCTLDLKKPLTKYTSACVAISFQISRYLCQYRFFFIFIFSSRRVTNRSAPLNPDVLFIKLSRTFFRKPRFGCTNFFFNLLGCVHFPLVKCWYCLVPPTQKTILQLHINNE